MRISKLAVLGLFALTNLGHVNAASVARRESVFQARLAGTLRGRADQSLKAVGRAAVAKAVQRQPLTERHVAVLSLLSPAERVQLLHEATGWPITTKNYASRSEKGTRIDKPQLRPPATPEAVAIVLDVMQPGTIGLTARTDDKGSWNHADAVWDKGLIGSSSKLPAAYPVTARKRSQGNELFPIWISPVEGERFVRLREAATSHSGSVMGAGGSGVWPVRSLRQKKPGSNGCTNWIHRLPLAPRGPSFGWIEQLEQAVAASPALRARYDFSRGVIEGLNQATIRGTMVAYRPEEASDHDRRSEVFAALRQALPEHGASIALLEKWAAKLIEMKTPNLPWTFIGRGTLSQLADMRTISGQSTMDNKGPPATICAIKGSPSPRVNAEIKFVAPPSL